MWRGGVHVADAVRRCLFVPVGARTARTDGKDADGPPLAGTVRRDMHGCLVGAPLAGGAPTAFQSWLDRLYRRSVPSATTITSPPTRGRSPSIAASMRLGRPISIPCSIVSAVAPVRAAR
jgi:hypothetical protein